MSLKKSLPPPNALVVFEAAARHLNFTKAGEELSVAQPAITRQIRLLEESLQVALFTRRNNAVALTDEGRAFQATVSRCLHEIADQANILRNPAGRSLTIGSTFGFANMWLAPRLPRLQRILDGMSINLLISDDYGEYDAKAVDFSIRFGDGQWDGLCADLLFYEEIVPLAAPAVAQAHDFTSLATWQGQSLLDTENLFTTLNWATWSLWFKEQGLDFPSRARTQTFNNYLLVVDAALNGDGIMLGFANLTDDLVELGKLVPLGPPLKRSPMGYYLVYPEKGFHSPLAKRILRAFAA
ncbi:LysR substrate-binding domain-containing protein [Aestuariispira insulae]|uniref:LysR family glycine cleavage system transcriptional activator n=1 Tax=Aestuariispira insulae TaxID=1461337 RepID=A0A3D9H2L7_9PROT|nr:LysR substrate-binding domain-containing protein [Aestuariispira insulae]RED43758.1 LysR family glycine cleavage system transcriptional activator [Aestuariispira insulae]